MTERLITLKKGPVGFYKWTVWRLVNDGRGHYCSIASGWAFTRLIAWMMARWNTGVRVVPSVPTLFG